MENSKEEDRFFICRIRKTLQKYNLPSPEEILKNPPKKQQWKNAMKKAHLPPHIVYRSEIFCYG
jgi:hypothetical protein